MRGFDIREWKALDWAGFASLIVIVLIPTINAGLKDYPQFASLVPAFISWPYLPVPLALCVLGVIAVRSLESNEPKAPPPPADAEEDQTKSLLPPPVFPQQRYHPSGEFIVLPLYVTVNLLSQPPEVEARFYVCPFLPRRLKLVDIELSVRVNSLPNLEDVTFRQKEHVIEPKDYAVVICRRQLTDAEFAYAWQSGRASNADFHLRAIATDGAKTFIYGPVSSMTIEAWVNGPKPQQVQPRTGEPITPPIEYQRNALQAVIVHLRRSGVRTLNIPQFANVLGDMSLRDGTNPIFEPLSIRSTAEAVSQLIQEGSLSLSGDTFEIPAE